MALNDTAWCRKYQTPLSWVMPLHLLFFFKEVKRGNGCGEDEGV